MQGVVHGCPYKAFDADSVTAALGRLRIAPEKVRAAVGKMQGGHFQLACAAAWEGAHGCECITGINHPNQVWAVLADDEEEEQALCKAGLDYPLLTLAACDSTDDESS